MNRISRTEVNTQQGELGIEYEERLISANVGSRCGSKLIMRSLSIHPSTKFSQSLRQILATAIISSGMASNETKLVSNWTLEIQSPPPQEEASASESPNQSRLKHNTGITHHTDYCQAPQKSGGPELAAARTREISSTTTGEPPQSAAVGEEGRREGGGPWDVPWRGVRRRGRRPSARPWRACRAARASWRRRGRPRRAPGPSPPGAPPPPCASSRPSPAASRPTLPIRPAPARSGRGKGALGDPGGETAPGGGRGDVDAHEAAALRLSLCLRCFFFFFVSPRPLLPWLVGWFLAHLFISSRRVCSGVCCG